MSIYQHQIEKETGTGTKISELWPNATANLNTNIYLCRLRLIALGSSPTSSSFCAAGGFFIRRVNGYDYGYKPDQSYNHQVTNELKTQSPNTGQTVYGD